MNLQRVVPVTALLAMTIVVTACETQEDGRVGSEAARKQIKMSEQQAVDRAEEIIHQAVGRMSPKPTLKPAGNSTGPCLAWDDHRSDDRVQVMRSYQLLGVPGNEAKKLVRQARDSWVKHGYKFTSSEADGDWSDPFPSVNTRTEPDDFSVEALTGVIDRKKGEGLAAITVTSPCFLPKGSEKPPTNPSALHPVHNDERAERRVLAHSSRIYDALRDRASMRDRGPGSAGLALMTK